MKRLTAALLLIVAISIMMLPYTVFGATGDCTVNIVTPTECTCDSWVYNFWTSTNLEIGTDEINIDETAFNIYVNGVNINNINAVTYTLDYMNTNVDGVNATISYNYTLGLPVGVNIVKLELYDKNDETINGYDQVKKTRTE